MANSNQKKILLIDDEEDIRTVAKLALESLGYITVYGAGSLKEALLIIENYIPDLILLDMVMPDADGITTLKTLRQIPRLKETPVMIMTANEVQLDQFESEKVIDIIKKPFNPKQLAVVIKHLFTISIEDKENSRFDDELKMLVDSYSTNLPDKIHEIKNTFIKLAKSWTAANYIQLQILIHKLSGSAGVYGYSEISTISAKIETILSNYDYDIPADNKVIKELDGLIEEIDKLSKKKNSIEVQKPSLKEVDYNLLYIFSNQNQLYSELQNDLVTQLSKYKYQIIIFEDLKSLLVELDKKNPLALIINFDYFSVQLNDPDLYAICNMYFNSIHTICIAKSGEFENRLNSVKIGCKSYYLNPVNMDELTEELEYFKNLQKSHYKVIIVDDDSDIISYYSNLLHNAKIENKSIQNVKEIDRALHSYQPDILLIDLNMPDCNGIELATIIRQNKLYENIPIIFLSTEENKNIQLQAMSVGADDFISKSADPNILIQTIKNKANRYKKIKLLTLQDNLTGAFNSRYMYREIKKRIEIYNKAKIPFIIGIVAVNQLQRIINMYGSSSGDQVLTNLYLLLKLQLEPNCVIGRNGYNEFLVIFSDINLEKVKKEMINIQNKFNSVLHYANGVAFSSFFNIGFATYINNYSIDEFIGMAKSDLTHDVNL